MNEKRLFWMVIDTLIDKINNGTNTENERRAILRLELELDRCLVDKEPTKDIEMLLNATKMANFGKEGA
jgi:hypothetical protein